MSDSLCPNIQPTHDNVLVRRIAPKNITDAGIVLPKGAEEVSREAQVLAIGPGRWDDHGDYLPVCCQPGQRVFIDDQCGHEIEINGEKLLMLKDEEVLCIITE